MLYLRLTNSSAASLQGGALGQWNLYALDVGHLWYESGKSRRSEKLEQLSSFITRRHALTVMVPTHCFLLAVIFGSSIADTEQTRYRHQHLLRAWMTLSDLSPESLRSNCPGCGARRVFQESNMEKYEITALRIEIIKQQILKKLRLKEPPSVSMPLSTLPKPLSNGTVLHKSNKLESDADMDDFYGTTDQVILFPQEGKWNIII